MTISTLVYKSKSPSRCGHDWWSKVHCLRRSTKNYLYKSNKVQTPFTSKYFVPRRRTDTDFRRHDDYLIPYYTLPIQIIICTEDPISLRWKDTISSEYLVRVYPFGSSYIISLMNVFIFVPSLFGCSLRLCDDLDRSNFLSLFVTFFNPDQCPLVYWSGIRFEVPVPSQWFRDSLSTSQEVSGPTSLSPLLMRLEWEDVGRQRWVTGSNRFSWFRSPVSREVHLSHLSPRPRTLPLNYPL